MKNTTDRLESHPALSSRTNEAVGQNPNTDALLCKPHKPERKAGQLWKFSQMSGQWSLEANWVILIDLIHRYHDGRLWNSEGPSNSFHVEGIHFPMLGWWAIVGPKVIPLLGRALVKKECRCHREQSGVQISQAWIISRGIVLEAQNRSGCREGDPHSRVLTATLCACSKICLQPRWMIRRTLHIDHVTPCLLWIESCVWTKDPTPGGALHLDLISTNNVQSSPKKNFPIRVWHHGCKDDLLEISVFPGSAPLNWQMG